MNVHVICCNDSVEFAVIEDEAKAQAKLEELRQAYFERNKWNFRDEAEYKTRCYWHIHTVAAAPSADEMQMHAQGAASGFAQKARQQGA